MEFSDKLEKLKLFYSEKFSIRYDEEIGGTVIPMLAEMHSRAPVSVFGFRMGGEKLGPEASEYAFIMDCEGFTQNELQLAQKLVKDAEALYIHPSKDHAFTFLSVVIVAKKADDDAVKALKKYSARKNYGGCGWMLARVAVLTEQGDFANKDGSDLKRLLQTVIAEREEV